MDVMKYGIGIDIGGTKCSVVSADLAQITLNPETDFLTKRVFETDVFDYDKMIGIFCECTPELYRVFATPRMAAFRAWQSPPEVSIPMRIMGTPLS